MNCKLEISQVFLSVEEVSVVLDVSRRSVDRWLNSKQLAGIKVGRNWKIPAQSLFDFLQESNPNLMRETIELRIVATKEYRRG